MNKKNQLIIIFVTILVIGSIAAISFFGYQKIQKLNSSIEEVKKTKSCPEKEIVEKVLKKADTWSEVQAKSTSAVVQVFSQIAVFDWLEPYKTPEQSAATGTGFFIDPKGYLITNAHVVDQSKALTIQISTLGKDQFEIEVVGISPDRDLALCKLKDEEFKKIQKSLGKIPYLKLGNSEKICRGDEVMVLGYPLGFQFIKSTKGIVSGRESLAGHHFIQIDAAINPGNSGGPVVDNNGDVVGIATAHIPNAQNVGYIIQANELKVILKSLYNTPTKLVRRPFLGVFWHAGNPTLTQYLNNPLPGGCYVTSLYKGSLLDNVGVKPGDMIYEINKLPIDSFGEISVNWCEDKISLSDYISFLPLDQEISFVVYRKGERKEFKFNFTQSKLPEIRAMYPDYEKIEYEVIAGIVIMQLTRNHIVKLIQYSPDLLKYEDPKNQNQPALVITNILPDSQAQRSRLPFPPGTIIKEINGESVKTMDDLRKAVRKSINNGYLTFKFSNEVFVVFSFTRVLQDEVKLSTIFRYPISPLVQELLKTFIDKNEKKDLFS